jgi:WD40 repeat protein
MASTPNLQTLIAHYLAVNYPNALPAFIEAAHVPEPDTANPPRPDLPSLVTEFYAIQASIDLSNIKLDEHEISHDGSWKGWTAKQVMKVELTADVKLGGVRRTLEGISAANLLTVGVQPVAKRVFDTSIAGYVYHMAYTEARYRSTYPLSIVTTSVDKSLRIIDYTTGEVESAIEPHKAAILCFAFHPLNSRYLLTGSMDGT